MRRRLFKAPPCYLRDWSDVLDRATRVKLTVLCTGHQETRFSRLLDTADPAVRAAWDELDRPFLSPVFAFLVEHPTLGLLLVDTGLDPSFCRRPHGSLRGPLTRFFIDPYRQYPGTDVAGRLDDLGAWPTCVLLTHLHFDHTAGLQALPENIRCISGRAETYLNYWPLIYSGDPDRLKVLEELNFEKARDMPPSGPSIDLLGDGSVWAIPTPGHTRGHTSYLVMAEDGPALVAGDAAMNEWQWVHGVAPGRSWDGMIARASLARLHALQSALPEMKIHYGHEAACVSITATR